MSDTPKAERALTGIKGLAEDLQPIAQYLQLLKRRLQEEERHLREELHTLMRDPEEAELDFEELHEALGESPEEIADAKRRELNPGNFTLQIDQAREQQHNIDDMIADMQRGDFADALDFLRAALLAENVVEGVEPLSGHEPRYREPKIAERGAIEAYIRTLESRVATR